MSSRNRTCQTTEQLSLSEQIDRDAYLNVFLVYADWDKQACCQHKRRFVQEANCSAVLRKRETVITLISFAKLISNHNRVLFVCRRQTPSPGVLFTSPASLSDMVLHITASWSGQINARGSGFCPFASVQPHTCLHSTSYIERAFNVVCDFKTSKSFCKGRFYALCVV
jgi:hypothetical protein